MTTQAGAAVAVAAEQPPQPKTVKGTPKWGDWSLRIVAGWSCCTCSFPSS